MDSQIESNLNFTAQFHNYHAVFETITQHEKKSEKSKKQNLCLGANRGGFQNVILDQSLI